MLCRFVFLMVLSTVALFAGCAVRQDIVMTVVTDKPVADLNYMMVGAIGMFTRQRYSFVPVVNNRVVFKDFSYDSFGIWFSKVQSDPSSQNGFPDIVATSVGVIPYFKVGESREFILESDADERIGYVRVERVAKE